MFCFRNGKIEVCHWFKFEGVFCCRQCTILNMFLWHVNIWNVCNLFKSVEWKIVFLSNDVGKINVDVVLSLWFAEWILKKQDTCMRLFGIISWVLRCWLIGAVQCYQLERGGGVVEGKWIEIGWNSASVSDMDVVWSRRFNVMRKRYNICACLVFLIELCDLSLLTGVVQWWNIELMVCSGARKMEETVFEILCLLLMMEFTKKCILMVHGVILVQIGYKRKAMQW